MGMDDLEHRRESSAEWGRSAHRIRSGSTRKPGRDPNGHVGPIGMAAGRGFYRLRIGPGPAFWCRRELTDSAWDQALEDAHFKERAIVVVMDDGTRYRGKLKYGGREDAQAAGWMYLHWPGKRNEKSQEWARLRGTHGLLIERSKIRLVQVYLTKTERLAEAADDAMTLAGTSHIENLTETGQQSTFLQPSSLPRPSRQR